MIVDGQVASRVGLDPETLEPDPIGIGPHANGDDHPLDRRRPPVAEADTDSTWKRCDTGYLHAQPHVDSVFTQGSRQGIGDRGFFPSKKLR